MDLGAPGYMSTAGSGVVHAYVRTYAHLHIILHLRTYAHIRMYVL